MTLPQTDLYFEGHVTLEPVLDQFRAVALKLLAKKYGFRVANLIKVNGTPNDRDAFCTLRTDEYSIMVANLSGFVREAMECGYDIKRYKIENTLLDSKAEGDVLGILGL